MNNPEFWTKLGKAIVSAGAVFGVYIDPAHLAAIYQGAAAILAIIYAVEVRYKAKKK